MKKKIIKDWISNSTLFILNNLFTTALNFSLIFFYARILGDESFGALTAAQTKVLIWIILVDFGLTAGLVNLFHRQAEKRTIGKDALSPEQLLFKVILLRIFIAILISGVVFLLAKNEAKNDMALLLENIAYLPYLFGYGIQFTLNSYFLYKGDIVPSAIANILGVFLAAALALCALLTGYGIAFLLFLQSTASLLSAIILYGVGINKKYFSLWAGGFSSLKELKLVLLDVWKEVWASALVFAVVTAWTRLDIIVAAKFLPLSMVGQYSLCAKLVAVPVLLASSVFLGMFSDFHKKQKENKIALYSTIRSLSLYLLCIGMPAAFLFLWLLQMAISFLLPKYVITSEWILYFSPAVWAYWFYVIFNAAQFGMRRYKAIAWIHGVAFGVYVSVLWFGIKYYAIVGAVAAYTVFLAVLAIGSAIDFLRATKKA